MWTLLKELGYTLREIDSASKAADDIRKHRIKSIRYKGIHDFQYKMGKIMRRGSGNGSGGLVTKGGSSNTASAAAHVVA